MDNNDKTDSTQELTESTLKKDETKFQSSFASLRSKPNPLEWQDVEVKFGRRPLRQQDSTMARVTDSAENFCLKSPIVVWLLTIFPSITWIRNYSIKNYLIPDIISGLTVSVIHVPQGMAYGLLAGTNPANGLYVSFFPVLIYALMSQSRHASLGTMAVTSIMTSNVLNHLGAVPQAAFNSTQLASFDRPPTIEEAITTLSFICAIFMLIGGIFQLGVLSLVLSEQMLTAFACGATFHIAVAQLESVLGITVPKHSGPLKVIFTLFDVLKNILSTNLACLVISIITTVLMVSVKEFFDPWLKKRVKSNIPIPIELFILIIATTASWALDLNVRYGVPVIGVIPSGLPEIKPPRLDLVVDILPDAAAIALVSYTVTLTAGLLFGKKYKYIVDPSQEMLALGAANLLGSFTGCFPATSGISRTLLIDKSGVKTQLAGIVSSVVLLFIILYLGHLFHSLPKCVLGCIILVCLKNMLMQSTNLVRLWKISRLEGLSWAITFFSVIAIDVDYGIIIGICSSLFFLLIQFILPKATIRGLLPSTEIYVDITQFTKAQEIPGLKIFRFSSALFFLNSVNFRDSLYRLCLQKTYSQLMDLLEKKKLLNQTVNTIIIDCSTIAFVDSSGVEAILDAINTLKELGIRCHLASCTASLMAMFERTSFRDKLPKDYSSIFPMVHDGVIYYLQHDYPESHDTNTIPSSIRF
ncbi:solute carrier family 26 member 10 [Tetranychus urticae]|uniref:STAS domain-containing protein n=1 Tax=Tetranychus urticae TaxID=32264 RepID=T1K8X9_TETUR|nr:solute carrier family 26 member 10 [Tetranychus urticae]